MRRFWPRLFHVWRAGDLVVPGLDASPERAASFSRRSTPDAPSDAQVTITDPCSPQSNTPPHISRMHSVSHCSRPALLTHEYNHTFASHGHMYTPRVLPSVPAREHHQAGGTRTHFPGVTVRCPYRLGRTPVVPYHAPSHPRRTRAPTKRQSAPHPREAIGAWGTYAHAPPPLVPLRQRASGTSLVTPALACAWARLTRVGAR